MRVRQINFGSKEEIIEYTHHVGGLVRCMVGHGEINETGQFIPTPAQNYEIYEITESSYAALMAADPVSGKPADVFRKDDLWPYIDAIRNAVLNQSVAIEPAAVETAEEV